MGKDDSPAQAPLQWDERAGESPQAMVDCLDGNPDAYFISVNSCGRIAACNHAMARLLGLNPEALGDAGIWDSLTASDATRLNQEMRRNPSGTGPLLLNFVTPNQSATTLSCSLGALPGGGFLILGVPARSWSEASELAWLQLNNSFATLSRESARKTKQLELKNTELTQANQALQEARAAALQAAQAKSDFLSHMSHEIRTPMNGVIGMIQLLLGTGLSTEQQRYAEVAQTSGRALLALIDDILDLSKIEAGKVQLENLPFDLRRTVHDVIEILRVQASAKGLAFGLRVSPQLPTLVRGDPHRLRQVLTNLAANAIKFTSHGEVAVDLQLEGAADGQVTVRFAVTDTGIGIQPDRAAALFSPFVQADASTTRKYGGTGLGLAISRQLVEKMGGTIGLDSREGKGSTFWFTAVFEALPEPVAAPAALQPPLPATPVPRSARILIAEDNPTNQLVGLAQLSKLGYQARAVANGAEALEALQHDAYDLVLMDCEMPVMDGYEATRRLRQSGNLRLPIIALTANAMTEDRDRCLREGMNGFLSKPVDLRKLSEMLATWIPAPEPPTAAPAGTPAEKGHL